MPGDVLGHAPVSAGVSQDVAVTINRPAADGETFHAMLHVDDGVIGTYEFPNADAPVTDANGDVVMMPFDTMVSADVPAVIFTVSNVGASGYLWESADPARFGERHLGHDDAGTPRSRFALAGVTRS